MRLGLIARAENRGLGLLSWDFARWLNPDRVLLVDMGRRSPYKLHPERFPGARLTQFADGLSDADMDWLIEGSDVILTFETPYDYRLYEHARTRGVKTVCQFNYEFLRYGREPDLPGPDLLLAPSTWRLADARRSAPCPIEFLPSPVDRGVFSFRQRNEAGSFVHVAGHRAHADRNGTNLVLEAARHMRCGAPVRIRTQSRIGGYGRSRSHVQIVQEDVPERPDLYAADDVLILPRRYGGQSLPMVEALSMGLPVVSLDVAPQNEFLPAECLVPTRRRRILELQPGPIECFDADPLRLASTLDALAHEPELVSRLSKQADEYAEAISWERMVPRYRQTFETLYLSGS